MPAGQLQPVAKQFACLIMSRHWVKTTHCGVHAGGALNSRAGGVLNRRAGPSYCAAQYEEFIRLLRSQGPLAAPELESAAPTQPASPGGGAPPRGSFGDATDAAKLAVAAVDTQGGGIERGCSGQEVGGLSFGQGGQQQSGELEGSLSAADMPADAATPMHAAREQWQAQRQHQEQTLPAASFALRPERSGASGFGSGGAGSASGGGDSIRLPGAPHNARDCEQLQQGPSTAQPRGPSSLAT